MRTPEGGHRSTQWVIQNRTPPAEENLVTPWNRYPADPSYVDTAAKVKNLLASVREAGPHLEWRAIRVETVQRIEDW